MLCAAALSIRRAREDVDFSLLNSLMMKEDASGTQETACELGYIPCNPLPNDGTSTANLYHLGPGKTSIQKLSNRLPCLIIR